MLKPKTIIFFATAAFLVLMDQITKVWVYNHIRYRGRGPLADSAFAIEGIEKLDKIDVIPGFFQIIHAQNPGAAFSMMRDANPIMFVVLAVVAMGVLLWQLRGHGDRERVMPMALGMIASGALGNAIDRVDKGTVTDFLRIYTDHPTLAPWLESTVGMAEWPSFNIADSGIVVGVLLFLVYQFFFEDMVVAKEATPIGQTKLEELTQGE